MSALKLATLNLYHFAEPGIFWHERAGNRTHDADSWRAKTDWVAQILSAMDADVVSFQEVVSVDALRSLCEAAGYAQFICPEGPIFEDEQGDGTKVYVNASVAIASRHPVSDVYGYKSLGEIVPQTVIDGNARFSRPLVRCVIDLPGIGGTVVYGAHFKSQGAFVEDEVIDAISDWDEKFATFYMERCYAGVDQVSRRAAEAGAVYTRFRIDTKDDGNRPVVLLGDLNDVPESHTIGILTQNDFIFSIGSIHRSAVPDGERFRKYGYQLYDAFKLVPNQNTARPVTHSGWGSGDVLDYAVVSNALNPANPRRVATVIDHEVWDDHFRGDASKVETSDHAAVIVTIEPR